MSKKLNLYNKKRNFNNTNEPKGENGNGAENNKRLIYAVQHHIARRDHYDLRLQWNGVLLSWAIPKGPSFNTSDKRLAVKVEDHPLSYAHFEGTIPKGEYGGGVVMLWDEGYWTPQKNDVESALSSGTLKFTLYGKRLKGNWAIIRIKENKKGEDNWLLIKEKDSYAKDNGVISEFNTSIKTGRTMEEIETGQQKKPVNNPFNKASAQLAKLVTEIPQGKDWLYEVKYDGYRILSFIQQGNARLITRNGGDYTDKFKQIALSLSDFSAGRAMVLDGEMIITDKEGRSNFQALQNYMKNPFDKHLTYVIFDILALDGEDLREYPLTDRKKILKTVIKNPPKDICLSKYVLEKGRECYIAACKLKLEGIIGKKINSVYSGTRNGDWIKLKCEKLQHFVIGGYTVSGKRAREISSLLLGEYKDKKLIFSGRAGTGLSGKNILRLQESFKDIVSQKPHFKEPPTQKKDEKIVWLIPLRVANIKFLERTNDNLLRGASFKGLVTDKKADNITMETEKTNRKATNSKNEVEIQGVTITNPNRVIFEKPLIKKADVAMYYDKVSRYMLPYIEGRILSVVRCPKGISSPCFFKKHPVSEGKGIVTVPLKDGDEYYFYIKDAEGIIFQAQMGTLEFHVWGSRAQTMDKPDIMVFDLDPDEGMDIKNVRQGVTDLKSILDGLNLTSFLKTSGGKGYHVVVPLQPSADWSAFSGFAKNIALLMEGKWQDRYTSNIRKEKRKGRIFIDWMRNSKGATSVAPYSLRAKEGASVSMPIKWEQLNTITPNGIDINNAFKIIDINPWKDFFKTRQKLKIK